MVRIRGLRRGAAAGRSKDVVHDDESKAAGVVCFGWWIEIVVTRLSGNVNEIKQQMGVAVQYVRRSLGVPMRDCRTMNGW
jgi:hypothetical protein